MSHHIVIELFDRTSDAEADEFVAEIVSRFQPSGRVFAVRGLSLEPSEGFTKPEPYTISTETSVNDEGSTFATVTITFADGSEPIVERFASWFDEPSEPAIVQAASYIAAFEETQNYTLEERLGPYGIEWEREQEDRYEQRW